MNSSSTQEPSSSSVNISCDIEEKEEGSKEQVVPQCTKKIVKNKRARPQKCILQVRQLGSPYQYFIGEQHYYNLNGEFSIYVQTECISDIDQCRKVSIIKQYDTYLSADLFTVPFHKDFNAPIHLLENSQNNDKYRLAQQLKDVKQSLTKTNDSMKRIQKFYKNKQDKLRWLCQQREQYKKDQTNIYIKEQLKEDDFYTIALFRENFDFQQLEIGTIYLSKPFMAFLGMEDVFVDQFLLHVGMVDFVFHFNQERFYDSIYYAQFPSEKQKETKLYKDFTFLTLDKIQIHCDVEITLLDIQYPTELQYECEHEFTLDSSTMFKFLLTPQHIKSLIEQRIKSKECIMNEFCHTHSIEYNVLSQAFLDKYYQKKEDKMEIEEKVDEAKICKYRIIK